MEVVINVPVNVCAVIAKIDERSTAYDALLSAVVKADQYHWDADMQAALDALYEELIKP
jgi:hypothetical protein